MTLAKHDFCEACWLANFGDTQKSAGHLVPRCCVSLARARFVVVLFVCLVRPCVFVCLFSYNIIVFCCSCKAGFLANDNNESPLVVGSLFPVACSCSFAPCEPAVATGVGVAVAVYGLLPLAKSYGAPDDAAAAFSLVA